MDDATHRKITARHAPSARRTMDNLLAESDYSQPQPSEEREWVDAPPAGDELL